MGALMRFLTGGLRYSFVHQMITMQMMLRMSAATFVSAMFKKRSRYVCKTDKYW